MRASVARWGVAVSPWGDVVVVASGRGLAAFSFVTTDKQAPIALPCGATRAACACCRDDRMANDLTDQVLGARGGGAPLALDLAGTPFQLRVWTALRAIPCGETRTYGDVARALGMPTAARAVGQAVGANPVAVLVPCHRVVRADGALGGYRWGVERKRALLAWERASVALEREYEDAHR